MENSITGRVIAISNVETIPSKDPSKQPMTKRKLFIDCTRYDTYTGQRDEYENTPLLEFGGKSLEKLENLIGQGLKKDDVVTIKFAVQGIKYTNKQGKADVFTSIRPYDIELRVPQQQAPAPTAAPAAQATTTDGTDGYPF